MWSALQSTLEKAASIQSTLENVVNSFDASKQSYLDQRKQKDGGLFVEQDPLPLKFSLFQVAPSVEPGSKEDDMPWKGFDNQVKQAILDLSLDQRNFTEPIPSDTDFEFNMDSFLPVAMVFELI